MPLPGIREALQLLERCLAVEEMPETASTASGTTATTTTDHPLCANLYIHVAEPSFQPQRTSATAKKLAGGWNGTQAQHLQHMPSHTYLRVGRYHDAVLANVQAHASDEM